MTNKLSFKRRQSWSQRESSIDAMMSPGEKHMEDKRAMRKAEALNDAMDAISATGNYFGYLSLIAVVYDQDQDKLRKAAVDLNKVFIDHKGVLIEEKRYRLRSFFATIPGNQGLNIRYNRQRCGYRLVWEIYAGLHTQHRLSILEIQPNRCPTFQTNFEEIPMNMRRHLCPAISLAFSLAFGTAVAQAQITYTCDPSVAMTTCNYLNGTIAGFYKTTFSNANASIYITYGTTGLGQSTQTTPQITYANYVATLTANNNKSAVQASALSALNTYDAGPYGSGNVGVTSALATALGQLASKNGAGVVSNASSTCNLPATGCYNAVITITNDPTTVFYYDDQMGTEPSTAYDFYAVVQHETDEVLGTASCISTGSSQTAVDERTYDERTGLLTTVIRIREAASPEVTSADQGTLTDTCGAGVPSAVDLYRYSSAGNLVLDSSLSTKDGAYFSYNGGSTKGAQGVDGSGKNYNTKANGEDYADFVSNSTDCATDEAIQNAEGCYGRDAGLNILNDGQGEINILNAVGYNLVTAPPQLVNANKKLVNFGKVVYSTPATTKTDGLDLTNSGSTSASVGPISITGTYGDVTQFSFAADCLASLDPGKKCHITLSFTPDASIISRATLIIPTSPGSTISIPLTGTGTPNGSQ
jgi:hypothetical protein